MCCYFKKEFKAFTTIAVKFTSIFQRPLDSARNEDDKKISDVKKVSIILFTSVLYGASIKQDLPQGCTLFSRTCFVRENLPFRSF